VEHYNAQKYISIIRYGNSEPRCKGKWKELYQIINRSEISFRNNSITFEQQSILQEFAFFIKQWKLGKLIIFLGFLFTFLFEICNIFYHLKHLFLLMKGQLLSYILVTHNYQ